MTIDSNNPWFYPIPKSTVEKILNPVAEPIGKGLGGIASIVMNPLMKLGVINKYNMENFERKIIEKNNQIPLDNRDDSKQGLALKALEDSIYQLDNEELQEMFSNLISSSLDNRKNSHVLPSFSTLLKDFTVEDAQLFKNLHQLNAVATVDIIFTNESRGTVLPCLDNILLFDDNTITHKPISINTLERLGLIEVRSASLVQPNFAENYKKFKQTDNTFYRQAERQLEKFKTGFATFEKIKINEGYITMTNLGKKLGEIVIT